ncbi:MAG: rhomboid family intramembrane serine protease [Candidatus Marinimicrobia bacterium]|nr:rhomboid family intramembrane serine protease [Candidatus Neomarinimicrobiota bacterium]
MLFPYRDDNPRVLIPYVTYAIIALNLVVFLYQLTLTDYVTRHLFSLRFGLIPANFWGADAAAVLRYNHDLLAESFSGLSVQRLLEARLLPGYITIFTAPFLHGGWMHFLGNMLFLYVFADNLEGALGHVRFTVFYMLAALAAGLLQLSVESASLLPVIGASGAISGVLGGYMVRYPRVKVHVLIFIFVFFTTVRLPAFVVLGWWFVIQIFSGFVSLGSPGGGGTAWFEHIGGFVAGFSYMAIDKYSRKLAPGHDREL